MTDDADVPEVHAPDTDDPREAALQTWAAAADRQARTDLLLELYRLRRERRPRLTQATVAERMGISQATVSAFESRKAVPRLATLQRYARAIGVRLQVQLDVISPEEEFADKFAELSATEDAPAEPDIHTTPDSTTVGSFKPRFSAMAS